MGAGTALWTVAGLLFVSGPATGPSGDLRPRDTMTQATGEFREGHYTDEHGTRRYRLYVPSGPGGTGRPLVVMLHGCTQDPEDFAAGTRANERAEALDALVLYPEQPASANPQKCWNWFDPTHQARGGGEPALLAGMTRQLVEEMQADPERVYVAGISAGGSMAQILAASYPELYRAVAVHSAPAYRSAVDVPSALAILQNGVPEPATLSARVLEAMGEGARAVPMLVVHGSEDAVVRPVNAVQVLRQWAGVALSAHGRPAPGVEPAGQDPVASEPCPGIPGLVARSSRVEAGWPATRCVYADAPVPLEYWLIEGLGHAWSGGSPAGTYTDPAGPDATRRVFSFFLSDRG